MSSRRRPSPVPVIVLLLALGALLAPAVAWALSATTTTISASPSPAVAGQPVTLTATPSVPGTVTFSYDGQVVGTGQAVGAGAASGAPARIWNTDGGLIRWMTTDNLGNVYTSTFNESSCSDGGCQVKQFTPNGGLNYAPLESHNGTWIWPTGLAVDSSGNIFEAFFNGPAENTIRKRTSIGATSTLFVPASAGIVRPCGMTIDASDNLYVASSINGNIYKVTPAGVVSTYVTDYDPVSTFGPCSPVINKTTGVLYYLKWTEAAHHRGGVIMQVPAGGGTPTQLANTGCYFVNWDPYYNHLHRHSGQLTIDQTTGYLYGQGCERGNDQQVTQISPTGVIREYMGAWYEPGFPSNGPNAGVGQNQTWGLAAHDGFVYLGGSALGGSHFFKIGPGAYQATYTFTPTTPGTFSTGASLAPTNSGSYSGSTGSGTLAVRPAAPSAPDLAAASDLGTSDTDNITSDNTPLIEVPGSYAAGNTITVTATKSGSVNVTCTYVIPATGCDLGTLADGTWSITATDTHPTGGASAASSALSITVDTTAPSAPSAVDLANASDTGSSPTDNVTSDNTPTMSVTGGSAGDTVTITASKSGSANVTCTYVLPAASCDLGTLADGTWSVSATLTDPAGNTSAAATPLSMTVDATGPSGLTPDLDASSDLGASSTDNITSDNTPTITLPGQATGDVITITASKAGSADVICSYTVGSATTCTLGTLADGTWAISAAITDLAGNTGTTQSLPITIDTSAPNAPSGIDLATPSDLGASSTDNLTSDTTPTMSAAGGSPGDTVTMTATKSGSANVTCTYVLPATGCDLGTLADGTWNVSATFTDPAGNTSSASPALPITIDSTPPSAPGAPDLAAASDTGTSSTDNLTSDTTPRIDVPGGTNGDTITVTATPVGGGTPISCTFVVGQATGCDLGTLADGQWTTSATATDPAGNVGPATAGPTLSIDATAPAGPATPSLDPASDTGTSNTDRDTADTTPTLRVPGVPAGETITLNATGPNGQTASCSFVASATVDSCDLGPLADGAWSIAAASDATDAAGNQASASAPLVIQINATPPAAPGTPKPVGTDEGMGKDSKGVPQTMDQTPAFTAPGATAPNRVTLTAVGPGGLTLSCSYVPSPTTTSCTLGPLADGLWTITPTQTNPAGITSPAGPAYTIRIGAEPKPNLPPDPYKVDVTKNGSGHTAEAWFAVPVDPKKVDAVIFVITDRTGKVIGRIRKPVTASMVKASMRIDKLPKGAKVSAYTVNRHGVSPRAPHYANVRHVDTRKNRTLLPSGGYRLLGSPLGDNVIFDGASAAFTPTAKAELDRVAILAKRKGGQLYITGFARRNGINSDGWLLRLSKRRAEAVAKYLADRGVTSWITWNGVGAATPYIGTPQHRNVTIRWAPVD
jgi:outer membrane protein OmpA-like peptidoglycan-associated protein